MKTKFKKISDSRVEITVTLEKADLDAANEKAVERLAKDVQVEGFRKGKAPVKIARKFIPENDLNAEAIDIAIRSSVVPAFREHEKMPLVAPSVNVTKYVPGEMAEYTAVADIVPEVKLADYKKLKVKRETAKISEAEVKDFLDHIASSFSEKKPVKRAAKLSDEVIIDFVGKKGGKAFEGGTAKDYKLVLGSKTFIPGFEEGIVGHEPGDKFDLKLTFPKDYGVKDLAGAKVVFETLLKQVNEVTKPEISDKLAEKVGFKNLKDLKDDVKKNLGTQKEHSLVEKFKDDLVAELVKTSKIPAPDILVEDQMKIIREDMARNANSRGMASLEEFVEKSGETMESWQKEARKVAETRVKASLALQDIALKEKVTVPDEEVAAKIAELRDVYKNSPEAVKSLKDPNVKMDIKNRMVIEKTLDLLVKANS